MTNKSLVHISLGIIGGIVLIVLFLKGCKEDKFKQDNNMLINLLQDSIQRTRNKDGSQTAKISLLQNRNSDLLLSLSSKDSTIVWLQREVKKAKSMIKGGGLVTVIESGATFTGVATTTVFTNIKDSCRPIYKAQNKDTTWIKWSTISTNDSTNIKISTRDKYSVVIGSEKVGLFKKRPVVEVISSNPYSTIKNMRAFEVKDTRTNRFGIGIQAGYGITLKGFGPYLGIGLNFKIL